MEGVWDGEEGRKFRFAGQMEKTDLILVNSLWNIMGMAFYRPNNECLVQTTKKWCDMHKHAQVQVRPCLDLPRF